jgi:hypothetical protein
MSRDLHHGSESSFHFHSLMLINDRHAMKKKLSGLSTGEQRSSNQYEDRNERVQQTGCDQSACQT